MISIIVYKHNSPSIHKIITDFYSIEAVRTVSDIGAIEVVLDADNAADVPLQPDTRLVLAVTRGAMTHIFGAYLLGSWVLRTQRNKRTLTLRGLCYNSLLTRRIIAYAAGTAQASKTGPADNIMRAVVRENLGASAGAIRDISSYGLLVEQDLSLAQSISMAFAWRNVYDVIVDIANAVYQQSNEKLVWDIQPVGDGWYMQFIVRKSFMRDRRTALWLSTETCLDDIVEEYDRRGAYNVVYAGWQGLNENRIVVDVTNENDAKCSVIARAEHFYDGASFESQQTLTAGAMQRLKSGAPRMRVNAKLVETESVYYGRDVIIGDIITVKGAREYNMILRTARLTVTGNDININIGLEQI